MKRLWRLSWCYSSHWLIPQVQGSGQHYQDHPSTSQQTGLWSSHLSAWWCQTFCNSGSSFCKSWWSPNKVMHITGDGPILYQHFAKLCHLEVLCSICYWCTHGQVDLWSHGRWKARCFCVILCGETELHRAAESFLARQKSITFDKEVRFWRDFFLNAGY